MKKNNLIGIVLFCTPYLSLPVALQAQDGSLDLSFDTDGIVTTPIGLSADNANSVAIQSDGKIVVAGKSQNTNWDFTVVRYNSNGSLDNTFDTDGMVSTPIGAGSDHAFSVAIQSDGKIVVAGYSYNGSNRDFAVVRYNSNGSLDNTFDTDGKVTTSIVVGDGEAYSMAIQSDGKIVLAGTYFGSTIGVALVRYNSNGSLDNTFDTDGIVTTTAAIDLYVGYSVAIQGDGKIVVSGSTYVGGAYDFALMRYNSNGSLDNTFDSDGIVITSLGTGYEEAVSVAIQSDGKILVAGYSGSISDFNFTIARYNSNGSLDITFDTDGMLTTPIGSGSDQGTSLVLQSDGKIVLAGVSSNGIEEDFTVLRYNSNGSFDNTFDTDGIVTTPIGAGNDYGSSIAIQSDGKILVAGYSSNGTDNDFALVRYNNPSLSVKENQSKSTFSLFPNPTSNQITLSSETNMTKASIIIINLTGQELLQQNNISGTSFTLDVSAQPAGLYFLEINDAGKISRIKFVKE